MLQPHKSIHNRNEAIVNKNTKMIGMNCRSANGAEEIALDFVLFTQFSKSPKSWLQYPSIIPTASNTQRNEVELCYLFPNFHASCRYYHSSGEEGAKPPQVATIRARSLSRRWMHQLRPYQR
mmetsp:Transcript_11453/g.27682  ORF Transcript_11453/g.27682 Transcript_11453/m.27682 type:complete len:122 (+) Transcript_11453:131-496(+)